MKPPIALNIFLQCESKLWLVERSLRMMTMPPKKNQDFEKMFTNNLVTIGNHIKRHVDKFYESEEEKDVWRT